MPDEMVCRGVSHAAALDKNLGLRKLISDDISFPDRQGAVSMSRELIEVFSGPPTVTFKWRHWRTFSGPDKNHAPTGETVEVVGVSMARVNEDLKIVYLEHFFDTSSFIGKLAGGEKLATGGCPFHANNRL